tara:strand:+ start:390 stop:767 length:378 start_codon:yes stop_codon:yes gene_type:complete
MSTIKVGTLLSADGSTTTQPSIPALDKRMAKAWVKFRGADTLTIRDSYNVSSITDNGVGNYSMNFTTAMDNAHYGAVCNGSHYNWDSIYSIISSSNASHLRIGATRAANNVFSDSDIITGVVFAN